MNREKYLNLTNPTNEGDNNWPNRGRVGWIMTLPFWGEKNASAALCEKAIVQCLINVFLQDKAAHFSVAFYCDLPKSHLFSYCLISISICQTCQVDGFSWQKERCSLMQILSKSVSKIEEKQTFCMHRGRFQPFTSTREKWEQKTKLLCLYVLSSIQ